MIKSVIFDLDGTLLDTTEGVLESAIYAAQELGFEILPHEVMLKFVGPPIQNSFMKYYGCDQGTAQVAANIFRKYYKNNALFKAKPYEGIYELCEELKLWDVKMAVATYKREDYALTILANFKLSDYCISIHGADNENKLTKADIVNICINELGYDKREIVLIGDTEFDAIGADTAGIRFVGVTFGFGFRKKDDIDKYPNIGMAKNIAELKELLARV